MPEIASVRVHKEGWADGIVSDDFLPGTVLLPVRIFQANLATI